ncbi:MAG TPA: hypothetical protein VIK35_01505 [Verrucomicrobiae bacterium]
MSESKTKSSGIRIGIWVFVCLFAGVILTAIIIPNFVIPLSHSAASDCINNLRVIDVAKNEWALINNKTTNDTPTWEDIKRYIQDEERDKPYMKIDPKSNLPKCPSGGTYTIGKVGELPTCSLGTTVTPAHVLP